MTMKDKGYEVVAAVTRMEEAAEICRDKRPGVILMNLDVYTTKQTLSAALRIRQKIDILVIYLSTNCRGSSPELKDLDPYLGKPFCEKLCAF